MTGNKSQLTTGDHVLLQATDDEHTPTWRLYRVEAIDNTDREATCHDLTDGATVYVDSNIADRDAVVLDNEAAGAVLEFAKHYAAGQFRDAGETMEAHR